ncbi:hypothetical protein AWB67_00767 [Caballeronia terrestris]|uniref:Uncharacterized protein n=1 Tax=Caballeronia terrestris TaxID=1226301 RepID=A0A158FPW9_9BURK|nr:hypothetical protein [Caballeronia terrestris]SAL21757.1 hypothetical protein AWB67_00767 [Caballeronia terrestris]
MLNEPLSHPAIKRFLLVVVYFLVASAAFNGFFTKWQFRDNWPRFSLPAMLEGTAERPFVYRQLFPAIVNGAERVLPERVKNHVNTLLSDDNKYHHPISWIYPNATDAKDPKYALRYYMMYALAFGTLFCALFAMRAVCLEFNQNRVGATLAPLVFAVIFPLILTEGGYFYDIAELLFMSLAVILAMRGRVVLLIILTAFATWNKESFLFFVMVLYPFLRTHLSVKKTLLLQVVLVAIAAAINIVIKMQYTQNGGDVVLFHLANNLRQLARPATYLRFEYNYGIMTPKALNIVNLLLFAVIARAGWGKLPPLVKQYMKIALVINVPLYVALGFYDEIRGLSMLYMGLLMMLCVDIITYLEAGFRVPQAGAEAHAPRPTERRDMPAPVQAMTRHSD